MNENLNKIFTSAAIISPPVLKLNATEQGIVVRVKPPKLHIRKMHKSLQFKIYLIHPNGEEVQHTHTILYLYYYSNYCSSFHVSPACHI